MEPFLLKLLRLIYGNADTLAIKQRYKVGANFIVYNLIGQEVL